MSGLGQASARVRGRVRVGQGSVRVREPVRVSELVEVSGLEQVSAQVPASGTVVALEQGPASAVARGWELVPVAEPAMAVQALLEAPRPEGRPEPERPAQVTANRTASIG